MKEKQQDLNLEEYNRGKRKNFGLTLLDSHLHLYFLFQKIQISVPILKAFVVI